MIRAYRGTHDACANIASDLRREWRYVRVVAVWPSDRPAMCDRPTRDLLDNWSVYVCERLDVP
jgi:hypothetical protein